jgi:predicted permease
LFARSSSNLLSVDPGFRTANVATFSVDARLNGYDAKRGTRLYRDLVQRLRDLPGVQSAAAANPGPFTESGRSGNIAVEGYRAKEDEYTGASIRGVTPGYFATIGVGVHAGREFTDKDGADAPKVAIVNEAFRQKYFGSESPLGHRMMLGGGNKPFDIEIVGLTGDYKHGDMREKIEPAVFVPLPQDSFDAATFYVRTTAEQKSLALRIRALVRDLDSTLSIFNMKPLRREIEEAIFRERMVSMLASCFAALATVLAALGVYGVIAYSVVRRTNEIGIRIALGALRREIVLLVFREVAFMALVGMASGVVLGLVAARLVSSQLYGIRSSDPLAFAISVAAILTVAVLASGIPAGRAAAIDPIRALRYE